MKIEFLRAGTEDAATLADLEVKCFAHPWSKAMILEGLSLSLANFFLVLAEGETVGYGGFYHIEDEGHIANLGVLPKFRRQGIGSRLLAHMIDEAKILGIKAMTLEVRTDNFNAQAIYKKAGFKEAGIRKGYYEDGSDAMIMWAVLASGA